MAQHMRNNDDRAGRSAKQANLLASAQAAGRRSRNDLASGERSGRDDERRAGGSSRGERSRHAAAFPEEGAGQDARSARATRGDRGGRDRRASRSDGAAHGRARQPERETLGQFVRRNAVYILSVVAVAVIVVLMLVFVRGCIPEVESAPVSDSSSAQASETRSYDWSCLDHGDGRYSYVVDGQVKSRLGIDVSENQHAIDWQAVAADGIEFAMIRLGYRGATEGDLYLDEWYTENLAGARNAGIDCGIYFFSQAQNLKEAVEEADFVIANLNGATLEYPIAFDSEEAVLNLDSSRTTNLSDTSMTFIAEAFCARLEQAGYKTIVYGNRADLSRYRYSASTNVDIWWAEYGTPRPSTKREVAMWQYSNEGHVAGIDTDVDMNIDLRGVFA